MKKLILNILLILFVVSVSYSQEGDNQSSNEEYYQIIKNDGTEFIGVIIKQDDREIYLRTKKLGNIYIPKHEIKSINKINMKDYSLGKTYIGSDPFSTRYFLTANALPIEEGEAYMLFRGIGPDFQMGITDNFGVGIMTTWVGFPLIANLKYSNKLDDGIYYSVGALLGSGTWALPELFIGVPFTSLTFGNRMRNLTLTGGYGYLSYEDYNGGKALFSLAFMSKFSKKLSFIFDSFLSPDFESAGNSLYIFMPGLRWHLSNESSFQIGFAGMYVENDVVPFPVPLINYMFKF
jgi:hypothetical protein